MYSITKPCPRCKCGACYPLHRKGIDWAFSWLGLRPARCLTCMRRFYTRYTLDSFNPQRGATLHAEPPIEPKRRATPEHHRAA